MLAVAALLPSPFAFAEANVANVVGEVSLVLGKAYLETAEGSLHELASGDIVHATDRIQTGSNGHVHIRFVDEALVSVRPDSRLEIQRYEYNPEKPDESAIRLMLEEGVTRAISGHGAKAASGSVSTC